MNTIYDGSYTLGSTSALSFEAGPGIKIDEPSAGTVRIGNDETVLWSGDASANIAFSESKDNFERIKIWCYPNERTTAWQQIIEIPSTNDKIPISIWYANAGGDINPYVLYRSYYIWNDTTGMGIQANNAGSHIWFNSNWGVAGHVDTPQIKITKVVGINRKEV